MTEVLHLPSQEMLVVVKDSAEFLIPFVESIVPTIDIDKKLIVIDPPEGLLAQDAPSEY